MVFARLLVVVALLFAAGACAPQPTTSQVGASQGVGRGIPTLPRELERDVGPAYPDAALQSYVDRVGQKLVARST